MKLGALASSVALTVAGLCAQTASPPGVDFQALAERDAVRRGESFTVFLLLANKSAVDLKKLSVRLLNPGFAGTMPRLSVLPGYGNGHAAVQLIAGERAGFTQHRLVFVLDYHWESEGKPFASAQTASLSVQVGRQFEEEAKGLPGGTAALLYLLLPLMPAFLAYEIVDSLRRGDGLKMPAFKTEYIVPAFLAAIALSFVMLIAAKRDQSFAYSSPETFATVLFGSAIAGAAIPGLRWGHQWRKYQFRPKDNFADYLRKALLQSEASPFYWVTGTLQGQKWEGVLLRQPNGAPALGARVQISPIQGRLSWEALKKVVDENGVIRDRKGLLKLITDKSVSLGFQQRIARAGSPLDVVVALDGLKGFSPEEWDPKPLIQPVP